MPCYSWGSTCQSSAFDSPCDTAAQQGTCASQENLFWGLAIIVGIAVVVKATRKK